MPAADDAFDDLVASLDASMVIVTCAGPNAELAGCLVGFHAQASIHPRRYAVWVSRANHTFRVALLAEHLAVHFPSAGDLDLAELFGGETGDEVDKFARCEWDPAPEGPPLLRRIPNRMLVRRTAVLDDEGSDHVCFVVEPRRAWIAAPFEPLRLSDVAGMAPGHPVDDRP